ncbi:phasin family protein [Spiribacter sp. SSL99]|uniref:phasin family protein n=1 Tax=Spiribacter sp. SSL99 TaxID=1866884 RepID=UPI001F323480|nr:phasin family protein [Spiribacter sp. SSL99]KAF0286304.1 phasin family protein [Spiribacter sp. SSL99]
MMNTDMFTKYTEQAEKLFMGPTRSYAKLAMDYTQKVMDAQIEAARTYTDLGMQQARAALDIKDPSALQQYAEKQQEAAKNLGERVKADGEKVVALNQDFANEARKLVESSAQSASETAKETVSAAQKATKGN